MRESEETDTDHILIERLRSMGDMPPAYDLMSRIMTDADKIRHSRQPSVSQPPILVLGTVTKWLGGWAGLAGMGATAALGLWIGLSFPVEVERITPASISKVLHGHDDFDLFFHHDTFVASDDV